VVDGRGRDERGQPLDKFQRHKPQLGASIGMRLGHAIDKLVVMTLHEPPRGEGWSRAIPQQPLQAAAVGAFNAHRGIQRETPTVIRGRLGEVNFACLRRQQNIPVITQQWKWTARVDSPWQGKFEVFLHQCAT